MCRCKEVVFYDFLEETEIDDLRMEIEGLRRDLDGVMCVVGGVKI